MKQLNLLLFLAVVISLASCNKDEDVSYEVPQFYDFENVSYTGQQERLAMLLEMKNYMKTSQTKGVSLNADRLKAMYANETGANFSQNYNKQLENKTFESVQKDFRSLMDELAEASKSVLDGSDGVSGVIESKDGIKAYLVGEDGLDHAQVIEKGLMGACFYYQATSVYMGDDRMNVDNDVVEPGRGTAMEHHWDEAFGYFGVPLDFPSNLSGLFFWGDYSNKRNDLLNSNEQLMDALIKGRAAITNNDLETRDEAITEARENWELVAVGSALHYINAGIEKFDDMAIRSHALSEAIGFVYSLQFNLNKKMSNTEIQNVLSLIAGSADFETMNLYDTSIENLDLAKDALASAYGLESIKDEF
ncbi:MAG: DUF4856 domain-containing protein [Saprospiraceae bacterium]|nr:DUF4856 domain-containing protein [Saprospiraceae bacterium]